MGISTEIGNIQKVAVAANNHLIALFFVPHVLLGIVFLQYSSNLTCTGFTYSYTCFRQFFVNVNTLYSQKQEVNRVPLSRNKQQSFLRTTG